MKSKVSLALSALVVILTLGWVGVRHFRAPLPCVLRILVPGYSDSIRVPRSAQGCPVRVSTYATTEELLEKLRSKSNGPSYDLVVASGETASTLIDANLVLGLDLKKIPAYFQTSLLLRELSIVRVRGQVLGVPLSWEPNEILYDPTVVKAPPESWNSFWLPKYRGEVAMPDSDLMAFSAVVALGWVRPGSAAPYFLNKQQILKLKEKLSKLKPSLRASISDTNMGWRELRQLFKARQIALAMGSPWTASLLRRGGLSIAETIPKEGGIARVDFLMIPASSRNQAAAYPLVNSLLEARTQKRLSEATGSAPANPQAGALMSPGERAMNHLTGNPSDLEKYLSRFSFCQNPSGSTLKSYSPAVSR